MAKFYVLNEVKQVGEGLLHVKSDIFNDSGAYVSTVDGKVFAGNEKTAVLAHFDALKTALDAQATCTEFHFATNSPKVYNELVDVKTQLSDRDSEYESKYNAFASAGVPMTSFSKVQAY
jgi:hypothetical protein